MSSRRSSSPKRITTLHTAVNQVEATLLLVADRQCQALSVVTSGVRSRLPELATMMDSTE